MMMKFALCLMALLATPAAADQLPDQVAPCWNKLALSAEAASTAVTVRFDLEDDGTPIASSIRLIDPLGAGLDAAADQAYEAAKRAVIRCGSRGYTASGIQELRFGPLGIIDTRAAAATVET